MLAVIWPEVTVIVLLVMFGAYALVDGIVALGTAIFGRRDTVAERVLLVVQGITGILAGILTFVWPGMTTLVLLWLIAGWAIITGVLGIAARRRGVGGASSRSAAKNVRIEPAETVPMTPAEYEAALQALAVLIARWWRERPEDALRTARPAPTDWAGANG